MIKTELCFLFLGLTSNFDYQYKENYSWTGGIGWYRPKPTIIHQFEKKNQLLLQNGLAYRVGQ